MTDGTLQPLAARHVELFRRTLPLQVRLGEIVRLLGDTRRLSCLDVGATNAMLSYHLRKRGGSWKTVARDEAAAGAAREIVKDEVYVLDKGALPAEWKKTFDVVVIVDSLECAADDEAFIEECHRVLKPDGRLILAVARSSTWALASWLRRLLRLSPARLGRVRPGYTESQLFQILKNGFDVSSVRFYSRLFVELVSVAMEALARGSEANPPAASAKRRRAEAVGGILYRLAYQLDSLLLFSRGYQFIALAKRRAWRPRSTPVLVDGRSISEAVLSKALD